MYGLFVLMVLFHYNVRLEKLEPAKPKHEVAQISIHDVNQ